MVGMQAVFGIIALIFIISALASGAVERGPLSFPMIFLALGFILGDNGLHIINVGLHDTTLEIVATLSLSFVLFLDAINLHLDQLRKGWQVPVLSIGPGTLLTIALAAGTAMLVLHFSILPALLLGTVLSSVDPTILAGILHDERVPRAVRGSLQTEAGAGDIVVLPVLLVLIAVASGQAKTIIDWIIFLVKLFLLGPIVGAAVGGVLSLLMLRVRKRVTISREYRALYGIGGIITAYLAGTAVGGSGFLAVFAAGLATSILDYDLCDCFLDYSEITSEMTMLLAFLLFGALLSAAIPTIVLLPAVVFGLISLLLARPIAIWLALLRAGVSQQARLFIGWFGPRGLSSLLFAMLLVSTSVPGAEQILSITGVVVILSVILHGITASPLAALYQKAILQQTLPEERVGTAAELFEAAPTEVPRITPEELYEKLQSPEPPLVLDVRSRSSYQQEAGQIPGSVRVLPGYVIDWAADQDRAREVVAYCT